MKLSEELQWRGFINQTTFEDKSELDTESRTFYWGVDPSAPSMTIGNLAAAMMVRIFIQHGYTPVLLVGGATGLIGDPDGKSQERDLKSLEEVQQNKAGIVEQYRQIFDGFNLTVVDNYEWFKDMNYLTFLRDVGKHVPMRQMLSRDFVQSRLGETGAGISYAEFSYSLIQGYDFLHLFEKHGVTLQISGADQWGNSIAGVDLIRRKTGKTAHVWTAPLIVNKSTGVKFGKSEDGAVWLDSKLTSPYSFYQFWLNVDDEGVEDYLKVFTPLDKTSIDQTMNDFINNKAARIAQKRLAYEVTKLIHGEETADSVKAITEVLFTSGDYSSLSASDFDHLTQDLPVVRVEIGEEFTDVIVRAGLVKSKSEARRFIDQGGVYVNGRQITLEDKVSSKQVIDGRYIILRRGKNSNVILKLNS